MSNMCDLSGTQLFVMLVFYTISQFGFCWIIADSKITLPVRKCVAYFAENEVATRATRAIAALVLSLLECVACLGVWIGAFFGYGLARELAVAPLGLELVFGLYTCGANFLLGKWTKLL